jgi:hypothetical protein
MGSLKPPRAKSVTRRTKKKNTVWIDMDGNRLAIGSLQPYHRATLAGLHTPLENPDDGLLYAPIEPANPLGGQRLVPSASSPICGACQLHTHGSQNPFLEYSGAENPLITVVADSVSATEDNDGFMGTAGALCYLKAYFGHNAARLKLDPLDYTIRFHHPVRPPDKGQDRQLREQRPLLPLVSGPRPEGAPAENNLYHWQHGLGSAVPQV